VAINVTNYIFIRNMSVHVAIISTNIYSHKQHTHLQSFITWQLVLTQNLRHHQATIQEHECIQKLSAISWISLPVILKMHLKCM
jgi:hypothetical protein